MESRKTEGDPDSMSASISYRNILPSNAKGRHLDLTFSLGDASNAAEHEEALLQVPVKAHLYTGGKEGSQSDGREGT